MPHELYTIYNFRVSPHSGLPRFPEQGAVGD